jgi:serine/threonine protein kinase
MGLELCPGGELFDQIKRRGRLPLETARFYAAEVVDCLEHIHSEGVIHRDLKVGSKCSHKFLKGFIDTDSKVGFTCVWSHPPTPQVGSDQMFEGLIHLVLHCDLNCSRIEPPILICF